eukprot:Nk52_evm40s151 gene=Nk52_evmTU40s151
MAKEQRKKHRTQKIKVKAPAAGTGSDGTPKSFVLHRGNVGSALKSLEGDMRAVMEPNTASKLRIRKKNVLKDFVAMAGPLGVSHFQIFNQTETSNNLRLARLPRGPTLTFHIDAFSLVKDIVAMQKKPKSPGSEFKNPPLVVLNNFSSENQAQHLMSTFLQNMFPAINVHTVQLADVKRCVLFNYNKESGLVEFRHFLVKMAQVGVSRVVKRIVQTKVPNIGACEDIADYILGGGTGGYTSESDVEDLDGENSVTLPQNVNGRGNSKSQQRAVKLQELGPRMNLKLLKIEDGFCDGNVLFHSYIEKSAEKVMETEKERKKKALLKEQRKRIQEENIKRKAEEKEAHRIRCGGKPRDVQEDEDSDNEDESDIKNKDEEDEVDETVSKTNGFDEDSDISDSEWYRKEVGEAPGDDFESKYARERKLRAKSNSKSGFDGKSDHKKKTESAKGNGTNKRKFGKDDEEKPSFAAKKKGVAMKKGGANVKGKVLNKRRRKN